MSGRSDPKGSGGDNPGPGTYNTSGDMGVNAAPSYSMRARTDAPEKGSSQPGPGAYDLGTTVGKAVSKSFSPRYKQTFSDNNPGPGAYTPGKGIGDDSPRYSMTSRHVPADLSAETPGPVSLRAVCWRVVRCVSDVCPLSRRAPTHPLRRSATASTG